MTYKNRLIFLISLVAALLLTYIISVIFSSNITGSGTSLYSWLDSRSSSRINKIVIDSQENEFELVRKINQWYVLHDGFEYPARNIRIEDFLSNFTKKTAWSVRSSSASTHERFGVDDSASRVTIHGEFSVLLDLLFGNDDVFRNETYVRKAGHNEVRSGDMSIKTYITSPVTSWYNLRLIPDSEGGAVDVGNVQRISVTNNNETQVFTRRNRGWDVSGINVNNPSFVNIESYIRMVINTEGDGFSESVTRNDPIFRNNRIVIELGNGRIVTINLSEADDSGRIYAHVIGRDYIYSIPSWSAGRLYRDAASFETQ